MADEESQLLVRIPDSLKYLVDQDERTNKELVISALETELGVRSEDSVAVIDRRIKRLEDRLEEEKAAMESRRDRLSSVQSELERARDIRQQKVEDGESYKQRLDAILDQLERGDIGSVFPTHGALDDIRREFDRSNEEVHLDLQQRAADQDRTLSVAHFRDHRRATREDERTPIAEKWSGEVEPDE